MKYEYCCKCDCATGKAGAGDDSLYTETDGPFCENCFPEFKSKQEQDEPKCKTHPDAPHGFVRNASHSEDRYVCECEFWEPPDQDEPVAYINVEQRKLEWAKYTSWETPTVVNLPRIPLYTKPQTKEWVSLMRGVRVEGNSVIITVNGYNDEARFLCKELIDEMKIYKEKNE